MANIRSAYAEVQAAALSEETTDQATYDATTGNVTATVNLQQKKAGWQTAVTMPNNLESDAGASAPTGGDQTVTITYTASTGKTTIDLSFAKAE